MFNKKDININKSLVALCIIATSICTTKNIFSMNKHIFLQQHRSIHTPQTIAPNTGKFHCTNNDVQTDPFAIDNRWNRNHIVTIHGFLILPNYFNDSLMETITYEW